MSATAKKFSVNENLTDAQVADLTAGKNAPGWYTAKTGQVVYICDGSHRDGWRGFKVLQLDGLK